MPQYRVKIERLGEGGGRLQPPKPLLDLSLVLYEVIIRSVKTNVD